MSCPTFFALNDRRDGQTELRIAAPGKSTTSIKQQKKEERLHSKRSPCKNHDGKIFATKCRQKHVCGGIAMLAMKSSPPDEAFRRNVVETVFGLLVLVNKMSSFSSANVIRQLFFPFSFDPFNRLCHSKSHIYFSCSREENFSSFDYTTSLPEE